ncbi:MAG TPA: transketolase C-terminal domain-containing protein, partial [Pirellulales bacterium]|nr:transketolase C-terminal domain-containing protein [Pirellulales bacterium]
IPSTPADAKGLFKTALRSADPVIFLEPKALFSSKGPVPLGEHFVPFGQANVVREGTDLTIVSCGSPVHRAVEAAGQLEQQGISCEVVDLRTIVPLDVETVVASVSKTGRLLVVDEGFSMCGLGAELAAVVMEHAFDELDAPVGRVHTDPVAHPFSPAHENAVVVSVERIKAAAQAVFAGRPLIPRRLAPLRTSRPHVAAPQRSVVAAPAAPRQSEPPARASGVPLIMPNQDLTITEARVIRWLKQIGQRVAKGEGIVEVETDKAVVTVDSPITGSLAEIIADVDAVVLLGQRLGTIREEV